MESYKKFLKRLDSKAEHFIISAFDDKKKEGSLPKQKYLTASEIKSNFGLMNSDNSYGLFVAINEFTGSKRRNNEFKRARAVFCEFDAKGDIPSFPIPPNIVVNSSPGKFHFYWITTTSDLEQWNAVQQTIVEQYGGDKNARDASRVLRLPGFYHNKAKPFFVSYTIDDAIADYSWEEITEAFKPSKTAPPPEQSTAPKTYDEHNAEIIAGDHFHGPTLAYLQMLKDGTNPAAVKSLLKSLFGNSKASHPDHDNHANWSACYSEIDSQVDNYARKLSSEHPEDHEVYDGANDDDTNLFLKSAADKLSPDMLAPPGTMIGELTMAIHGTWWAPNLMISALAARATVAYLAGGNYKGNLGDRINLQQCAIGITGCGKDLLVSGVASIIQAAFEDDPEELRILLSGVVDEAGSAEGLEDKMRSVGNKHDLIFVKDEIGDLMQQASKGNQAKAGIFNYFLRMYTKSDQVSSERARAKAKGDNDASNLLYAPHFIVSGATTPELIVDGLNSSFVGTGIMSRLMLFDASRYKEKPLRRIKELELSDELAMALRNIVDLSEMETPLHKMPSARVYNPKIVEFTDAVIDRCYEATLEDDAMESDRSIWNRRVPNAKKYAMCEAILEAWLILKDN